MSHSDTQDSHARSGAASDDDLRPLAEDILSYCDSAAEVAEEALLSHRGPQSSALVIQNSFTDTSSRSLSEISDQERRNLEAVLERPAVARLVTRNDAGVEEVIYITPSGAPRAMIGNARVASYRSAVGKLAAQPIGQDVDLHDGRFVELRAKTTFKPERQGRGWNAYGSVVETAERTPRTIVSLRALLDALPEEDALQLLEAALRGGDPLVFEGIRRTVVERMSLREQPLLDQYQDAIFRRPLDSQMLILGPPGSGKTTTLIKRLGLKIDQEYLTEDEKRLVAASVSGGARHGTSWLMFSPSELLRQYVKEAFAREQVPASNQQMVVWDRFRDGIARDTLGILRSGNSKGANRKPDLQNLLPTTIVSQTDWYDDFIAWQRQKFWSELNQVAQGLRDDTGPGASDLIKQLVSLVETSARLPSPSAFPAFRRYERGVRDIAAALIEGINTELRKAFAEQMRADGALFDRLLAFVQALDEDPDDLDDGDLDDDEDDVRDGRLSREAAFDVYIRAVRAQARAIAVGRRLPPKSRNARIIEWIGDRLPPRKTLVDIGKRARHAAALRRLSNPMRAYLRLLPLRYRGFRAERASEGRWYADVPYARADLSPLEIDLLVLGVLRSTRELLALPELTAGGEDILLERVVGLFRTQILIDEATDFSALQLACMAALADPVADSFAACGDFNQRITDWGVRSLAEIAWISPKLRTERIEVTYRHSRQLNALAHRIASLTNDSHEEAALPAHVENEGVMPVLGIGLDGEALVDWLDQRIGEVEKITGALPSLAVLVNTEQEVVPLAEKLGRALEARNIRCTPCLGGQATGDDGDVRVFDIQHIKGLEFEGVFFVGVDRLAEARPDLFNKYLYVGTTRAAMYLGMTTERELPATLNSIADAFGTSWSNSERASLSL
ncbi:ATP-binding domain-containing protein [Brevundimonas sp. AAP58]|uniref:ATP-binding domain-containing protein n=1 Tax=Brevundimonas sp. AAP58 TaxID=1523422 RepID=UPI0009EB88E7|nr:ATP-binding domain-containing protein [Brevundimonas sp. AAP58]